MKNVGPDERRRVIQIGAVALATLICVGLATWGLWAVFGGAPNGAPARDARIDPATDSTATVLATVTIPADSSTNTVTPPAIAATSSAGVSDKETALIRAAKIAYVLDGALYVADEDATHAVKVGRSSGTHYALSPDGRTVAVVSDGHLDLVDVATRSSARISSAIEECPAWSPDSSRVLYARRDTSESAQDYVWEVDRQGVAPKRIHRGSGFSISPDGRTIAVLDASSVQSTQSVATQLFISRDGSVPRSLGGAGGFVSAVAAGNDRIFVGVLGPTGEAKITSIDFEGKGDSTVFGPPSNGARATWGTLTLSPGGTHLAAVAAGDDGYSRISILKLSGGAEIRPESRRDAYSRCWSATGKYLYYVQGNLFQGQPTTLYRVESNGVGRKALVVGGR